MAAVALAPLGCSASLEPIQVGEGCPDQPIRGPLSWENTPGERLIDDFEDGDVKLAAVQGRDGGWILGWDTTRVPVAENSSRCAARGRNAGHFAGSGFTDWGANWTAVFKSTPGVAVGYDASSYHAISFWAAVGPGAEAPLEVPVGLTTVDNAWNSGNCNVCMDYYRTTVALSPSWQRIVVPFDTLAQKGDGDPLTPLRPDQLVGFIIWPTHGFDLWIDDVRFEP